MAYIALKTVKFDKVYNKDDVIPDDVIDIKMIQKLINCGMIREKTEQEQTESEQTES